MVVTEPNKDRLQRAFEIKRKFIFYLCTDVNISHRVSYVLRQVIQLEKPGDWVGEYWGPSNWGGFYSLGLKLMYARN